MDYVDLVGWIAGSLVLTAFHLKTMVPLRSVAIASNIAFIAYGVLAHAVPITVLHALLLPLNLMRLIELMNPAIQHKASAAVCAVVGIDLHGEVVIGDAAGFCVECLYGSVNVTSAGRHSPVVLACGDHCSIDCGGPATLRALTPARCQLTVDPAQRLGMGRMPVAANGNLRAGNEAPLPQLTPRSLR